MSKFKDDVTGNFYTQALFLELSYGNQDNVIYTLKDEDHEHNGRVLPSIKRLYLEIADPTEYEFATACFAGWNHWQRLCASTTQLHSHIEAWRTELEVKLRSQAVAAVVREVDTQGKGALSAAKWLADKGWAERRSAGRPNKQEVKRELKQQAAIKNVLQDDLARIQNVKH